jgi:hypothetical protein
MKCLHVVSAIFAVIFAFVAAILWWLSARVKTPDSFSIHVARPNLSPGELSGLHPIGGTWVGQAHSEDLIELANALRHQSKLSASAAVFAGFSAFFQAFTIFG